MFKLLAASRWGALQEWEMTHTHTKTSLTGTAPHYLLLDTGPHAAQQRSTPDTVGRGKGSMDSVKTTASLARCRADHATTAHSVHGTSAVSTHAPCVSSLVSFRECSHLLVKPLCQCQAEERS